MLAHELRNPLHAVLGNTELALESELTSAQRNYLVTIDEFATLEEAMEAMQTNNCRHLPVMRNQRVVGFLSMRDLMNYELARKTEELSHIRAYVTGSA